MTVQRETFYQQIRQNKLRSILLVLVIVALLGVLGYFAGYFFTGDPAGALIFVPLAMVLAGVLSAGAYFGGDSLVLAASGAREVSGAGRAAARQRRPRDEPRRQRARADGSTSSTTARPTPSPRAVTLSTPAWP